MGLIKDFGSNISKQLTKMGSVTGLFKGVLRSKDDLPRASIKQGDCWARLKSNESYLNSGTAGRALHRMNVV